MVDYFINLVFRSVRTSISFITLYNGRKTLENKMVPFRTDFISSYGIWYNR